MKYTLIVSCLFASSVFARPVEVILDVPKEVVQDHTASINLGVRLKSGAIVGGWLFDLKDFKAGITAKTLNLDEPVESCTFQWLVMDKTPVPAGQTPKDHPGLIVPQGFSGIVEGQCALNQDDEIRLTLKPYQVQTVVVSVDAAALKARQANRLVATVQPVSDSGDTMAKWTMDAKGTATSEKRVLYRGKLEFKVSNLWIGKSVVKDLQIHTRSPIELK